MERTRSDSAKTVQVTIERILPGGLGLAHAEDKTLLVALAAPGDQLRVRIDRVKGNVAFASIVEIITPSNDRVEPPCPYFGRCGGCNFQQLNYQAQLDAKVEIIKDCLHRIGKIETIPDFEIVPAPNQWHYRARAQWQYDAVRRRLGYFEAGSRRVCDVAECAVLVPELQQTLEVLRNQMAEGSLPAEPQDFRAVVGDNSVSVVPSVRSPTVREGSFDRQVPEISRTIASETYTLNANSFFQTNVDLLPELLNAAIGDANGEAAIELYCGVGLFTVPLARKLRSVIGVESDSAATDFARRNLKLAGISDTKIFNEDVGNWLARNEVNPQLAALDFLLLDPPRTGAESRVIAGILKLKPRRISYVSCDPATLARDLRKLIAGGYSLDSIVAFDMFPQTHHVETVARLSG